jgi:hypothetical protein
MSAVEDFCCALRFCGLDGYATMIEREPLDTEFLHIANSALSGAWQVTCQLGRFDVAYALITAQDIYIRALEEATHERRRLAEERERRRAKWLT